MEEKANIVRTSIRMDRGLHKKINDYVHDRKYRPDRTSIDAVVQDAVRLFFERPVAPPPVPTELHRRVSDEAARRGVSVEFAYTEALNEWLSPTAAQPGNVPVSCPPEMEETIREIIMVLNQPGVFGRYKRNAEQGIVRDAREPDEGER